MEKSARRRWFPRFSLLTLLVAVMLVGSGMMLWWHWEPWVLEHVLRGHSDKVISATFSPDGRQIATVSWDATARIWDATTGKCLCELKWRPYSAIFSPDSHRVVTPTLNKIAPIWNTETRKLLLALKGHPTPALPPTFSRYT